MRNILRTFVETLNKVLFLNGENRSIIFDNYEDTLYDILDEDFQGFGNITHISRTGYSLEGRILPHKGLETFLVGTYREDANQVTIQSKIEIEYENKKTTIFPLYPIENNGGHSLTETLEPLTFVEVAEDDKKIFIYLEKIFNIDDMRELKKFFNSDNIEHLEDLIGFEEDDEDDTDFMKYRIEAGEFLLSDGFGRLSEKKVVFHSSEWIDLKLALSILRAYLGRDRSPLKANSTEFGYFPELGLIVQSGKLLWNAEPIFKQTLGGWRKFSNYLKTAYNGGRVIIRTGDEYCITVHKDLGNFIYERHSLINLLDYTPDTFIGVKELKSSDRPLSREEIDNLL